MIVASDRGTDGSSKEMRYHSKAGRLRLPDIWRPRCLADVCIVDDERSLRVEAFLDHLSLAFGRFLDIAADVLVSRREVVVEICGLAGALQTDEYYGFRHRSNLGGRTPCRIAPRTGT